MPPQQRTHEGEENMKPFTEGPIQLQSQGQDLEHEAEGERSSSAVTLPTTSTVSMNQLQSTRTPNPYTNASFLSRLFFQWPYALLKLGLQRPIEESDLPDIDERESSKFNLNWIEQLWNLEVQRVQRLEQEQIRYNQETSKKSKKTTSKTYKPSLQWAIILDFIHSTWWIQLLLLGSVVARIVQAVALGYLIQSLRDRSPDGYLWASVLTICNCFTLFEHHHVFALVWRKGSQIRIASVAAIFAKSLRLSSIANWNGIQSGQVMNLVSNDVERFIGAALFGSYIFWGPVIGVAGLVVGILLIGPAFAAGISLLIGIFVPLQFYLSHKFAQLRSKVASLTDTRVTLLSQAIHGVRVMKMSGWETQFEQRIAKVRKQEITQIQKANRLKAWNEAIYYAVSIVVSATIFVVHVALGGSLTPRSVFTTITLVNAIQLEMTKHFSLGVMGLSECWVSMKRIQHFFETEELTLVKDSNKVPDNQSSTMQESCALSLSNVCCFWNNVQKKPTPLQEDNNNTYASDESLMSTSDAALTNVTIDFHMNSLTCIIGSVGSGKSALLLALIGELPVLSGTIDRNYTRMAYAPQDPWIMNGTIRENITMGLPYNPDFYQEVIAACGLEHDFSLFIHGEETLVGDRGVQLSGGQRARISLARALYRNADVLMLDDPLSAVDSRVGRLIFYSAIQDLAVKRGKCVILVTHQHQFIGDSRCIMMSGGRVANIGHFKECVIASSGKLHLVAQNNVNDNEVISGETCEMLLDDQTVEMNYDNKTTIAENTDAADEVEDYSGAQEQLKEFKATGSINRKTFVTYARAMGGWGIAVGLLALFTITQASVLISIGAMGRWAQRVPSKQKDDKFIGTILGLAAAVVLFSVSRALSSFAVTIGASKRMHNNMTKAVLRSKIEFFDTNPSGRILNRFSADVGSNDDNLPMTLFDFMSTLFMTLGAVITCIIVLPFTLIVVPPLIWYFMRCRKTFVTTSRELKRLEGGARSPIYAMLSESLSGVATIRANNVTEFFTKQFEELHNAHSRAVFSFIAASRWLGFRMDSIMFVNLTAACYLAVVFNQNGWFKVDAVVLGLALTLLIQLGSLFQWCIRLSAEVVNAFVSVERVSEYSLLPSEAPLTTNVDETRELTSWPSAGRIQVENLSVRYRSSLPLSLKGISFHVESGQRVACVGRTGSGKSTLVQSLLRILEAEEGKIIIDGIDISMLGLHKLRRQISVINQVPTLFSGCTVRENLDPFGEYSDGTIRNALNDVQMMEVIDELELGLDSIVAESGSNFSVGQRQLLCLARAILRKNQILVLDEPTANVDGRTDKLLQAAVKKSFQGATIISVAHRLDTVIDFDKILVLGSGRVLEFGSPHELLTGPCGDGHFASLVDDTGREMSQELRRRAKESFMSCTV